MLMRFIVITTRKIRALSVIYVSEGGNRMKADKEIRILAQLLEVKTELQEQALGRTGASKRMCLAEIKGIDKALEIVRKGTGEDD